MMPTPEEWQIHARAIRSQAVRTAQHGEIEVSRTLLSLAEKIERHAALTAAAQSRILALQDKS